MSEEQRHIILMDEQPPCCPICQRRLDVDTQVPVEIDADGPIFRATCIEHGDWRVQDDPEPNDET